MPNLKGEVSILLCEGADCILIHGNIRPDVILSLRKELIFQLAFSPILDVLFLSHFKALPHRHIFAGDYIESG